VASVQCVAKRRLVLKSPSHTARIELLAELFPGAKFVQITRAPEPLFGSTRKMFRTLVPFLSLERATLPDPTAAILNLGEFLHRRVEEAKPALAPDQFHRLRFEDLLADPCREMAAIYERLGLAGFDDLRPRIERYFADHSGHRLDEYSLTAEERAEIRRHWGPLARTHGYSA
jgi:hypothetical protein